MAKKETGEDVGKQKKDQPFVLSERQREKMQLLGNISGLTEAKINVLLEKGQIVDTLNDTALQSLVAAKDLKDGEARALGLTANLYQLFDGNIKLTETVKKGRLPEFGRRKIHHLRNLAGFDSANWLAILRKARVTSPDGITLEDYADMLSQKVAALYPTDAFFARMAPVNTVDLTGGIERMAPLYEGNSMVFSDPGLECINTGTVELPETEGLHSLFKRFLRLDDLELQPNNQPNLQNDLLLAPIVRIGPYNDIPGLVESRLNSTHMEQPEVETIHSTYTQLKRMVNLYPGMDLGEILDDPKLAPADKAARITERIGWLNRVQEQNPNVEFLKLDFSPGSEDVTALNLKGLSEAEQARVHSTLKSYQRAYFLTKDVGHARTILESGYRSATGIVNAGFETFARSTGFSEEVAQRHFDAARGMTVTVGAGVGTILDYMKGGFNWLNVSNIKENSLKTREGAVFNRLDDFEALFGSQTYCQCQHCQSIFSPAAYFVDLMYFLETNLAVAIPRLKVCRPDLWTVELTCDNTNTEIPTLEVVNEILEKYIFERIFAHLLSFVYILTDASFQALRIDGVPDAQVLNLLISLKDKKFSKGQDFLAEIGKLIEPRYIFLYGKLILKYALSLEFYLLTDDSFQKLQSDNVPSAVLNGLQSLKNRKYCLKVAFMQVVEDLIGAQSTATYKGRILEHASAPVNFPDIAAAEEMIVFMALNELSQFICSFRRPLSLPIEKLQSYLAHFSLTRAAIAEALEADPAVLARTTLNLSLEEYTLITREKHDLYFLDGLYCVKFALEPGSTDKIKAFDVQDILSPMGLSRSELGELIKTRFVGGGIKVIPGKQDPDNSVQNDIEFIYNLTPDALDRMHRFTRLWRRLPPMETAPDGPRWTIAELDLVLFLLESAGSTPGNIDLENLATVLSLQERWGISVAEICGLYNLNIKFAGQLTSLIDRLFNLPSFGKADNPFPRDDSLFVHPAFLQPGDPVSTDDALHRLHAGLQVNDGELYQLIVHLDKALGLDLTATKPVVGFYLTAHHLTLLYRYARLAKLMEIPIPELFQCIELAVPNNAPGAYLTSLADFAALLKFYDWWQTSGFSFDELAFITGGTVLKPEAFPDAQTLAQQMLVQVQTNRPLDFADTVFAFLEGVTEEQSRQIIAANSDPNAALIEAVNSEKTICRLSTSFDSTTVLAIPDDVADAAARAKNIQKADAVTLLQTETRAVLLTYHASEVIPTRLAALLSLPVDKLKVLIAMTGEDLYAPAYTQALRGDSTSTDPLGELVAQLLRLSALFRKEVFDPDTLDFINNQKINVFSISKFEAITTEQIRKLSVYKTLADGVAGVGTSSDSQPVFSSADVSQVLSGLARGLPLPSSEQGVLVEALTKVLQVEVGLVAVLLNSISLPQAAPEALMKLARCAELDRSLGVGGATPKLIISDDYNELELACAAVLGALRAVHSDEQDWLAMITPIEDRLLSSKRDALSDFLLQMGRLGAFGQKPGMKTMHDLYHYFLIDVELEGCARTSRVVAAISSVQLYIQRILMNLESAKLTPKMVKEWEWRKNYRVWEANRKVFLYPENYIEPDLRDDKTPLFEELEAKLLQQEITQQNVLDAYTSYLSGFEEVARLKIAGSYHDIGPDEDTLHLFGVTPDNPPTYYYRAVNNAYRGEIQGAARGIDWSHWRKIDVQIPVRKVAPVVYQGRLFVFWVEFTTTPKNDVSGGESTFVGYKHKMTLKYTILRLDGTWTAPQVISLKDAAYSEGFPTAMVPVFPSGDGIIEDLLSNPLAVPTIDALINAMELALEAFTSSNAMPAEESLQQSVEDLIMKKKEFCIPQYDTEPHIGDPRSFDRKNGESWADYVERVKKIKPEPKDGYTLTGFQWDQVYPSIWGQDLIMTGSNFGLVGAIDFYKKAIDPINIPPRADFSSSLPQILTAYSDFDADGKMRNWLCYCSGLTIWPFFCEYAACSAYLKVGKKSSSDWGFKGTGISTVIAELDDPGAPMDKTVKVQPPDAKDPLPGSPLVEGTWASIKTGHEMIYMGGDRVLDWEPATGHYRIWAYDRTITGGDPLPGSPLVEGVWSSIKIVHELIYMDGDRVLDWVPATGQYRIWAYDRTITNGDPLPGSPLVEGTWSSIRIGHELIYMGGDRLLDWVPATGHYRIWAYDRTITSGDPLPGSPLVEGTWSSIKTGHNLIYMGGDRLLDWEPATGHYRIWAYDRKITNGDPLPGSPLVEGIWGSIKNGHELIYMEGDMVLDWEPATGHYRIWAYDRTIIGIYTGDLALINGSFLRDTSNIVHSSLQDCIMDFQGDLFLLQGSVDLPPHCLIKRLGTTLSGSLMKTLFMGGVNELLDINTQINDLHEEDLPFTPSTAVPADVRIDEGTKQSIDPTQKFDFKHGPYGVYYREIFFHIPFLIADHLNSQGHFADAQRWYHYIFNPTAGEITAPPQDRNWRYLEFRNQCPTLREILTDTETIEVYKNDPWNPHAIARLRLSAYQKSIVMKYIDNLLDWGDSLFAQFTRESVNEATLLYIMAADILGERPAELGECGEGGLKPKNYETIRPLINGEDSEFLQEFTAEMETRALSKTYINSRKTKPAHTFALEEGIVASAAPARFAGAARGGIFKAYDWKKASRGSGSKQTGSQDSPLIQDPELISDFSASIIRTVCCRSGSITNRTETELSPVFCVPVNTDLLGYWDRVEDRLYKIRHCLDINGVRRDLALFAPEIDPRLLVQMKATGLTLEDVLGAAGGNLPPYRFTYLIEKAKQYAATVQSFGAALLSSLEKKDVEQLNKLRSVHEQNILKLTRQIKQWEIDTENESIQALQRQQESVAYRQEYYQGLIDQGLTSWERTEQVARHVSTGLRVSAAALDTLASITYLIPQLGSPFSMKYGGMELGNSSSSWSQLFRTVAEISDSISASAGLEATFERREQEWKHQLELAGLELKQVERQLAAAAIRQQIMNRSLEIHDKNIEQAKEVHDFYADKFSSFGLYTWLSTTLQKLYRDAYNSAFAMAQLAEQAYRFERDEDSAVLLEPGHWEASRAGLLAGEYLTMALQNMERKYIETNYRTFEIEQSFSLAQIKPEALVQLRETGSCEFDLTEMFFDLCYPGHYRRLIKSVRLTIPCVTGPYSNVGATLRLTKSHLRPEPKLNVVLREVPLQRSVCIATSKAQNDAGVFELNFHDERYMPFEGAGAVNSSWKLELPNQLRSFDYDTIPDIILHMSYTAKDGGDFKNDVENKIVSDLSKNSIYRLLSLKHELPNVYHQLLHPAGTIQSVEFALDKRYFPYFLAVKSLNLSEVRVYLKPISKDPVDTKGLTLSVGLVDKDNNAISSGTVNNWDNQVGNLKDGSISLTGDPINKWNIGTVSGALDIEKLEDILILLTYTASA